MNLILDKVKRLPNDAGVYVMKDKDENIIYVGKAKNLKKRVSQYFLRKQEHIKVKNMVSNIANFDFFVVNDELEALALENNLIKKHKPYYNILLKDDKSYPYLKINLKEDFPKFTIVRSIKRDGSKYFGPYMHSISAVEVLNIIKDAYKIRPCTKVLGKGKTVVTVLPDTAERYFSTPLFEDWFLFL